MLLKFPDFDSLRATLGAEVIPKDVLATPLTTGVDEKNQLWIETTASLARSVQAELRKRNVQMPRTCPLKLGLAASTWLELAEGKQYLVFSSPAQLRMALSKDLIPRAVSQEPVSAGWDGKEHLWVEVPLLRLGPRLRDVLEMGVVSKPTAKGVTLQPVTCWPQLLPLGSDPGAIPQGEQTPVLFEVDSAQAMIQLSSEILRLGNDRQTFRWIEPLEEGATPSRGLLRVLGPPYYSLLNALDRPAGKTQGTVVGYVERTPRVWVQLGYSHPLVEQIVPPPGQMLLLQPPRQWVVVPEAPFRDLYEVMDFVLPEQPVTLAEGDLEKHLQIHLRLRPGGPNEGGELWVLDENPMEKLTRFVQEADDQLLQRLAFAVGESGGQQTIVVRVRQTRMAPPVLQFDRTVTYRSFLKLPNLFLPCGMGLRPPLRRDQVRKLLASDTNQVYWLKPVEDNKFVPQSLPEDAFRPLMDWVDYILDHDKDALTAWIGAAQFEFEPFICNEKETAEPEKPGSDRPREHKSRVGEKRDLQPAGGAAANSGRLNNQAADGLEEEILDAIPVEMDRARLQEEVRDLEARFQSIEGSLDAPERLALWPQLAQGYANLDNKEDSAICWMNALWVQETLSVSWCWQWLASEAACLPAAAETKRGRGKHWLARLLAGRGQSKEISGEDLDALLSLPEPSAADVRSLAALLVWASQAGAWSAVFGERLNPLQRFLETHERLLPIRVVWLAWLSLFKQAQGDVLALARTRDRLLERLYQGGLRPEQDMPSFLRFAGHSTSLRFRAVRQWLIDLAKPAHAWGRDAGNPNLSRLMDGYVDLIFAFGLARLGENDVARTLLRHAQEILEREDHVHQLLLEAYQYRIRQALDGKPHGGPLPSDWLENLRKVENEAQYKVDRLRQHSSILEPNQRINPYRRYTTRTSDLERELAELVDIPERKEVVSRVQRLFKGTAAIEGRARILLAALELAPRISEDFAREMLALTLVTYDAVNLAAKGSSPETGAAHFLENQARFLEKGLAVAAHFDNRESIHLLVERFKKLLREQRGDHAIPALEAVAAQCFRGLRKLGMREEIDLILVQMHQAILQGRDLEQVDLQNVSKAADLLRALLHVASGWFYFGRDREAEPIVQVVREVLFRDTALNSPNKARLAVVYAGTVGHAPVEAAQRRLEELLDKLGGFTDGSLTKLHFNLCKLDVIEAIVLAVVSDDFTLGSHARRWLDDDEFLIRRRIHRDVREAIA